ncbi:hypothetical protein [Gordonia iterans]
MSPKFVMVFSSVLMVIAAAMMVGQQQWTMLAILLPVWLLILGFWLYRQRIR